MHHIYVVFKENNKQYVVQEVPMSINVDEAVAEARKNKWYICHFITKTPQEGILDEIEKDFQGVTYKDLFLWTQMERKITDEIAVVQEKIS